VFRKFFAADVFANFDTTDLRGTAVLGSYFHPPCATSHKAGFVAEAMILAITT
jgi:hypothetical protein